jgi:hypothetical protein
MLSDAAFIIHQYILASLFVAEARRRVFVHFHDVDVWIWPSESRVLVVHLCPQAALKSHSVAQRNTGPSVRKVPSFLI